MTHLPLNDSALMIVNRDIALLLTLLTVLSAFFRRFPQYLPQWAGFRHLALFIKDSFWELLAVFILRSFFFEFYIIPSESMQPTVYPGDVILVSKFPYGIKLPGFNTTAISVGSPKTGDIVVFLDPVQPTVRKMIKRVVGLPGDHIQIEGQNIILNGQILSKEYLYQDWEYLKTQQGSFRVNVQHSKQSLGDHSFVITEIPQIEQSVSLDFVVPVGHYFVMGDNRNNSHDSRYIGFVPERFFCGRAEYVVFSFGQPHGYRDWSRIGRME